jgi:cell division protein FtsW (lipid II flippase)
MVTNVDKSHAMGFNAILGSTVTGLLLIASIATTVIGLTSAIAVVITTILFAGFVSTIFLSHTVRDWLNAHSLAERFGYHSAQNSEIPKAE